MYVRIYLQDYQVTLIQFYYSQIYLQNKIVVDRRK